MNDNNYTKIGIFFSFIFLLTNDMTSKFIGGFATGIFVSTKYDFKPYVSLIEDKIISLQKELENKRNEINKEHIEIERPQMADHSWRFNWPWSDHEDHNKPQN